jgi:sulfur-oxidizing protein SoxX
VLPVRAANVRCRLFIFIYRKFIYRKEFSVTKSSLLTISAVLGALLLGACRTYPDNANDFRFPILNGDIARGQQAFVSLGCPQCHVVSGVELPAPAGIRAVTVELGGELIFAKTYGDLVTSIINPDHVISERYLDQLPRAERRAASSSPMYVNPDMKVSELIDVVAFLNSRYSLLPGYTEYYY